MGAQRDDIHANISTGDARGSSSGALAVYLARSCGHVLVDERIVRHGYRFHASLGDEIPAFFNKRISTGSSSVSITLQAGIDPEHPDLDPFADCRTTKDAQAVLDVDEHHTSLWVARVTVGVQMREVCDLADPLFVARHPNEFRAAAEELVAIGVLAATSCTMCACATHDD